MMSKLIIAQLTIGLCLLSLTACMVDYAKTPPTEIAQSVRVKDSNFDAHIRYVAPRIRFQENYSPGVYHYHFLRGWKDKKSGHASHQLYVETNYSDTTYIPSSFKDEDKVKIIEHAKDWRFYRTASFEDASRVNLVLIDTDVECQLRDIFYECDYQETVGVPISEQLLKRSHLTGLTVRTNAQSGHESFITIPANYIQGYLEAFSLR